MTRTILIAGALVVALVTGYCAAATDSGVALSGVKGIVVLGPTCPVERADSPCPDQPLAATIKAARPDGSVARTAHSGSNGRFTMALEPGTYTLRVTGTGGVQVSRPITVTVPQRGWITANVMVDSGIR